MSFSPSPSPIQVPRLHPTLLPSALSILYLSPHRIGISKTRRTNTTPQIAKDFGKKFATGSSVTKTPSGGEEIVVQGDVSPEIEDPPLGTYNDRPADNNEFVDDKTNTAPATAAAAAAAG